MTAEFKAEAFRIFAERKFAATEAEHQREELEKLGPAALRNEDELTDEELETALAGDSCLHGKRRRQAMVMDDCCSAMETALVIGFLV